MNRLSFAHLRKAIKHHSLSFSGLYFQMEYRNDPTYNWFKMNKNAAKIYMGCLYVVSTPSEIESCTVLCMKECQNRMASIQNSTKTGRTVGFMKELKASVSLNDASLLSGVFVKDDHSKQTTTDISAFIDEFAFKYGNVDSICYFFSLYSSSP